MRSAAYRKIGSVVASAQFCDADQFATSRTGRRADCVGSCSLAAQLDEQGAFVDILRAIEVRDAVIRYMEACDQKALGWQRAFAPANFHNLRFSSFLHRYCWAIYSANLRSGISAEKFNQLKGAFKNFDPARLSRMRSISRALEIVESEKKAFALIRGCRMVQNEGFSRFKQRLRDDGAHVLHELPGIGCSNADALGNSMGINVQPNSEVWISQAARECATRPGDLLDYLAAELREPQRVVRAAIHVWGEARKSNFVGDARPIAVEAEPIDTAPRNGTFIRARSAEGDILICHWQSPKALVALGYDASDHGWYSPGGDAIDDDLISWTMY